MINLKYLVTGTGRCGTVFMARYMTSMGILCGHESIFDFSGLDNVLKKLNGKASPVLSHASLTNLVDGEWVSGKQWIDNLENIQADSSYMAAPYLKEECLAGVPVIHVVRDPVKVAHSFANHIDYFQSGSPKNEYEEFIYSQFPVLREEMSCFDRTALYLVLWNEMIEEAKPALFYRVEDGPQKLNEFLGISGQGYSNTEINTYKKWSSDIFETHKIQDHKIRKRFIDMGRRYGYKMSVIYMV